MPNYANGKIYSIRSRSRPDLIYIGSTIRPLSERLASHKSNNERKPCTSKQIIDLRDYYIELIETYPCSNVEELRKREGHFQRSMDCVNQLIAGRTRKQHYQENKKAYSAKSKQYRQDNKDIVVLRHKRYFQSKKDMRICICGNEYNYGHKQTRLDHYRSKKHQTHIQRIYEKLRSD